ncbi:MAG TPA: IS21 family transposase [Candidatus Dormibacteraeota bacterium]|nr:IS21 family transposase [Candidatus Dormibacteraeota bacterium]
MYSWEPRVLLRHYLEQGLSKTAIAARVGLSRRTLYRWLAQGKLDGDLDATTVRYPARRTKLDPYKPLIAERLTTYPELTAVRLFDEVQAAGYAGRLTQLRDFVRQIRPRPAPEPLVRFETPPGHQAQVDWARCPLPWGVRWGLFVVLGYSRLLWLQFFARQTLRTLLSGLEAAFHYVGGVPAELLFDQLKAVILEDRRPGGGRVLENPEFLRFAAHWGFRIRACRPYRAQTKGKVERPVRYVRQSFLYGRSFAGDADLNAQALQWLDQVANGRVHATTREAPRARFERDERAVLRPLAPRPYQSLVLLPDAPAPVSRSPVPHVAVERRSLAVYAALAGGDR